MAPFNHFDFIAPYYDRFMKPEDPTSFNNIAGLPVAGKLLDVGGGTGRKAYILKNFISGVVIVDSSMGMLSQAIKKDGLFTLCSEAEQLPFLSESFERIIMVDALHHVSNHRKTLNELWRVVKPGGRIVIEEPDIRTTPTKIMAIMEKMLLMRSHFMSPLDIAASFNYPNARIRMVVEDTTAWIVIDKRES